jgi:SSS family solute:Na+ symporter
MSLIQIAVILFVGLTLVVGIRTYSKIKGRAANYYVAGNAMPVAIVGITLCAQAFDANGSMGNAFLSFSNGFWAGAAIPIGLACCLFLTGKFFARPLHRMRLLTLADFYRRRYDNTSETLATVLMMFSNIVLVAGNLAGLGLLLKLVFGLDYLPMVAAMAVCILAYAVSGGLYATITTSVLQVGMFIVSIGLAVLWLTGTVGLDAFLSSVPSDSFGLDQLFATERGALVNWAALCSLALGDVVAIDFIQRVISAKTPRDASRGCYLGGSITLVVGLLVTIIGLSAFFFGKEESPFLLVDLALNDMPMLIGGAVLLGVIAASMSTASGVVLDLANLVTRNMFQRFSKNQWDDATMLRVSRWVALPTMGAAVVFAYLRPEPGILLILAFDIVLAGCFVPLVLGLYWSRANTPGAIAAMVAGTSARIILHFVVPKHLVGLDTLLAPVISLAAFVCVSLLTQKSAPPRPEALTEIPAEQELVTG